MQRLIGGIMIAVGILIAGASGLCSAFFLSAVLGNSGGGDQGLMVTLMLFVGGFPFVGGIALVLAGRHLLRSDRGPDRSDAF